MLSAAIKRQYSSVLPSLRHCLPVFDKICGTVMNFVFFVWVTLIKIANTLLDKLTALVLSVIRKYCSCTGLCQIWLEILTFFQLNGTSITRVNGGAGPKNDAPRTNNRWKRQNLKMTDQITGLKNAAPVKLCIFQPCSWVRHFPGTACSVAPSKLFIRRYWLHFLM